MAQQPQMPFDLSQLPPNALEAMKKEMQRRFALFLVGAVVTIVFRRLAQPAEAAPRHAA